MDYDRYGQIPLNGDLYKKLDDSQIETFMDYKSTNFMSYRLDVKIEVEILESYLIE